MSNQENVIYVEKTVKGGLIQEYQCRHTMCIWDYDMINLAMVVWF